jgi:peptide/nickel transport system ATP-binding protein
MSSNPSVRITNVSVSFPTVTGPVAAVASVSLDLPRGQITGLVGESGSGKSTLALSLLNAVPSPGRVESGAVEIGDVGDVLSLRGSALRKARGASIGYVFQASQNSLNPSSLSASSCLT